ncbi:hypothetical protein PR202_ga17652 [Eleusine coracana subsp. coracana]|uniref:Uncharacterized protein n=1 Tax=Eleusine coracana subsp. coracana TaxID=191504 RepID=A0AAV5CQN8_ELECO|nr:hypothetical protein PR202_ga17405 [Eleusine coracana subsp. coracana]GJN00468.1 hypothetical protein PR202_ga17652 [Eleusine coracana subsp. coracana]
MPAPPRYPSRSTTARRRQGGSGARWRGASRARCPRRRCWPTFLPTGTLLAFETLLPAASGNGTCSAVSVVTLRVLLALCGASCFVFHFTDSFRAPDGKVYYGFVTPRGLSLFRTGLGVEAPREDRFRLGFVDVVHAVMSVLVFAAIALSDYRVSACVLPGHGKEMKEVMESFPLMVAAVCSGLFLMFPNTRYGIGCLAA